MKSNAVIFSGNANLPFAEKVAESINTQLGGADVVKFSDGENYITIHESVRGKEVYIIQPTCPPDPANNLMELLVFIDALKRASAASIVAVMPYFGYARQDRRPYSGRVPITAKLVANMLTVAGANRILTVDLHADQIQGFFDIPVDNLYASTVFIKDIKQTYDGPLIISPDVGGVVRARAIAKMLGTDLAIVDKRRPKNNVAEVMNIIGNVEDRDCIIVDDMIDTAGTLCKAAEGLKKHGAKSLAAYSTHPVFSGTAVDNINQSMLDRVVVSDSIPLTEAAQQSHKISQLSIANMVGETIKRIHLSESVRPLLPEV